MKGIGDYHPALRYAGAPRSSAGFALLLLSLLPGHAARAPFDSTSVRAEPADPGKMAAASARLSADSGGGRDGALKTRLEDEQIGKRLILMQAAYRLRQKGRTRKDLHLVPHRAALHAERRNAIGGDYSADCGMRNRCL